MQITAHSFAKPIQSLTKSDGFVWGFSVDKEQAAAELERIAVGLRDGSIGSLQSVAVRNLATVENFTMTTVEIVIAERTPLRGVAA